MADQKWILVAPAFKPPQPKLVPLQIGMTPTFIDSHLLTNVFWIGTCGDITAFDSTMSPPRRLWTTNLQGTGYNPVSLIYDDGALFAATAGTMYKLDAASGQVLWQCLPQGGAWLFPTLYNLPDRLLVGGSGFVSSVLKSNGDILWTGNLEGTGYGVASMALHGNTVVATSNGELFAFDLVTGKTVDHNKLKGCGYGEFTVEVGGEPNLVYVGGNGWVAKVTPMQQDVVKTAVGYGICSHIVHKGVIYAGCAGKVTALNSNTLTKIWENNLPGTGYGVAMALMMINFGGRDMLVTGHNNHLCAIDISTGSSVFQTSLPGFNGTMASPFLHNGQILAGVHGNLHGVDPLSGRILWTDSLDGLGYGSICFASVSGWSDCNSRVPLQHEAERHSRNNH